MAGGRLDRETILDLIERGEIDTVLMVFPDLQGRFMGKRVTGEFFRNDILDGEGAIHACNYLLAVDMEMEPLPGFAYANWDTGYGDLKAIPDMNTLRLIPWLEKTALVICDAHDEETGEQVEVSPRRILKRQIERAQAAGYTVKTGSELEFYLFKDSFEDAAGKGYRALQPHSTYIMDYHILQTTKDEYLIRRIRNGMDAAGVPVEFSKGEFGRGQQEINLRYADALEMADRHMIYKNGVKEMASQEGRAVTFMAKWSMAEAGSSFHLHSSLWDEAGDRSLMWQDDGPHHMSSLFRRYLGGLMDTAYEMSWMFAPFVNSYKRYRLGSWAPTAIVWGHDNRTCGFRIVGEHGGFRVECRIPGADANPYLAFAATIAGGLHGIENGIEPPEMFQGNAYEAKGVRRVPSSLHEAVDAFKGSETARKAFGDFVFEHLLNTALQEQVIFDNNVVTDWELERYFERG
ncbi:MAG TPA: glutamine synthetase family protein [Actinomycetota bacterium]|nr:glutamine synthetase family protein [Actinomycetota bacterium]